MRTTVFVGIVAAFALLITTAIVHNKYRWPPCELAEVAARMRAIGLHVISSENAATGSVGPITAQDANCLTFASPDWTGKVRAWTARADVIERPDTKAVVWGDIILYGDPEIVDRLIGW